MDLIKGPLSRRDIECMSAVERLTSGGWPARLKDISESLKVRPPTALQFLERLTRKSLLEKGPAGYRLTMEGTKALDRLRRAHRLFESLLSSTGVSAEEACRISSLVDRHLDEGTASLLCARLSHPRRCPHGMPIPAGDEND
jgi:DtxR family Mn-dependent transcriptional regulator